MIVSLHDDDFSLKLLRYYRPAPHLPLAQTSAEPASATSVSLDQYTPQYFNADEWAFIKAAVDRLIPADEEGPGALELNVPVFIDKQMDASFGHAATWYMSAPFKPDAEALWGYQGALAPRDLYRAGIAALDAHCKQTFSGHAFAALDAGQQTQLLEDMDGGKLTLDTVSVRDFFTFLLQNTKEGYLADPMYGGNKDAAAWKMIGFPGARADFLDWVGKDKVYPFPPVTIEGQQNS
jgi:gluconate 2-dehydrogenase gamma chain